MENYAADLKERVSLLIEACGIRPGSITVEPYFDFSSPTYRIEFEADTYRDIHRVLAGKYVNRVEYVRPKDGHLYVILRLERTDIDVALLQRNVG